jgi:shikimate dehydrogenase
LARAAQAAGAGVIGGLELLVRQAALQVEIWSGRRLSDAPVGAMRAAGEAALRERASGSAG